MSFYLFITKSHLQRSNTEYVLIRLILRSDQKIDANAWCDIVYTMFPGNIDHVVPCSREHDAALTKLINIVYFCISRDVRWTNQDHVIQIMI